MTTTIRVPGQIRRHVLKAGKSNSSQPGWVDLYAACQAGDSELKRQGMNTLNTIELHLTNAAIGSALDIARSWLDSDNGNNVMAGKSMLKFELEYEPDDPREIRHAIKMPKSIAGYFEPKYGHPSPYKGESEVIKADMERMSWTATGAQGRVRAETLGLILNKMDRLKYHDHSAVARASKKFVDTFTEPYERTQRLISGYLSMAEGEDQAPDFMGAIHSRDEVEAEPKRLVIIACGGKKSDAPGRIPAEERYTGNYFNACREASEVMDGPTMVLSAKYGLISLTEEIENYDVRLGDKGSVRLGSVKQQVEKLGLEDAKVTVLGGEKYVKAVRQVWPDAEAPLKGGIGQQLKQLAGIYGGEVLEDDEHQAQESEEERPERIYQTKLQEIGYLPGRNQPKTRRIWFGGKAGKANPHPGQWVKAEVTYIGEGEYAINRLGTDDELMTCRLRNLIHWGPLNDPNREPEFVKQFARWDEQPAAVEKDEPQRMYKVPENWIELAEEGNTPQARAYWKRRCEEYRKTGK
ncbi:DUF6884 domain-containing protein [Streptomyces sp. NPDC001832]|uniref:DUF6884 domain-containing protein n=1 Tax=Streptomyces sp. NPDC001832 TaxID=3154527 RepID=UPI003331B6D9